MSGRRIYIAGPMTGIENHNVDAFNEAAGRLREEGWFVVNPVELSERLYGVLGSKEDIQEQFNEYPVGDLANAVLDIGLAALSTCSAIYLLEGWENSRGSRVELRKALDRGLEVIQERKMA